MSDVKQLSQGQWVEILTRLGANALSLNRRHHPCPACGGSDRFRFDDKEGRGTHICSQCGAGDGFELVKKMFNYSFKEAAQTVEDILGIEGKAPSKEEQQRYKQKLESERKQREETEREGHRIAAKQSLAIWEGSSVADDSHPYLKRKGVNPFGLGLVGENLIMPMYLEGEVSTHERITPEGVKKFATGGRKKGAAFRIAGDDLSKLDRFFIGEGFSTCASARMATAGHTLVAGDSGNLLPVATLLRQQYKDAEIIILADNDQKFDVNTGLNAATKTAESVNGAVVVPEGKKGFNIDWNDIHQSLGLDAVRDEINRQIKQPIQPAGIEGWPDPVVLPDALLPVDSFDADMLPSVFRDYALDVASRMQCPIEFVAVSIMTTFGGVVGKRCSIYPKAHDDWLVVPNLWGALVGRPSTMKSPAITAATAGVDGLVKEARSEFAEACEQAEIKGMVYDAEKKSFKDAITKAVAGGKDIPTAKPEKPSQPVEHRYITNAGTVENLIKLLSENENGIIQLRDELMGWIRSMDNPSSQDARSFYLEAWNGTGSSFSYDTMSHGHLCLDTGACVAVLGGVQPSLLAGIVHGAEVGNSGDDGMLQRFQLLVYPDKDTTWKYCDRKPNNAFSMALKTAFKDAVSLSGKLHFDAEAQPIFINWYSQLMHRLKHEDHLGMESHLSKYPQLMPAIALLIHIAEHAAQGNTTALGEVNKRAALRAVAWCDFLETHARRIYAMGDRIGVDAAKKVVAQVLAGKLSNPFTIGELKRKNLSGLKGDQVIQSIEMLEQYGWIKAEVKTTPQGGRPTTICTLHPKADFFMKRPDTPLTKLTKPIKRGCREFREGGV